MFLGESGNPRDPFVSPLYVGLAGLPPLDIQAWSDETLLDDSSHPAAGVPGTPRHRPPTAGPSPGSPIQPRRRRHRDQ